MMKAEDKIEHLESLLSIEQKTKKIYARIIFILAIGVAFAVAFNGTLGYILMTSAPREPVVTTEEPAVAEEENIIDHMDRCFEQAGTCHRLCGVREDNCVFGEATMKIHRRHLAKRGL